MVQLKTANIKVAQAKIKLAFNELNRVFSCWIPVSFTSRAGELDNVSGIDAPYEAPTRPDLHLDTMRDSIAGNVAKILAFLQQRGLLA